MFDFSVGSGNHKIHCFNVTPVSFEFYTSYPSAGTTGAYQDGKIIITGQADIVPDNAAAVILGADITPRARPGWHMGCVVWN